MRRLKYASQEQRFLSVYGVIQNLFRLGRHRMCSENWLLRECSYRSWSAAAVV